MSDLILTSYLENGELKTKIVQESEGFWFNFINCFKHKCGPNLHKTTIEQWQKENNSFRSALRFKH